MPNTSIGSRITLEPFISIGNSVIMDDTTIGSHSRIIDTVIGERCSLADHTSISTGIGLMEIEGQVIRSEFGAVLGDTVVSGPFTSMKNSIIGNSVTIEGRNCIVSRSIQDNSMVI